MMRRIVAVVAGMLVVGAFVGGSFAISAALWPMPAGLDPLNPEHSDQMSEYVLSLPILAWVIAFGAEIVGASLGAWTAGKLSPDRRRIASGIVIGLGVFGSINNWMSFEHPLWFMVGQLVLYPVGLMVVWRLLETDDQLAAEAAAR